MSVSSIRQSTEQKMAKSVESLKTSLSKLRTGRAHAGILDHVTVDYYGTQTPLNQVAGISTPDPHLIVIQPWDRSVLSAIEKAITKSDIGLMPNVDGTVVRLNVPPLTEERRREMVKQVRRRTEEARVEVRNHRREAADVLDGTAFEAEVTADIELARALGATGVPFFVFDRKYAVSGAQQTALFTEKGCERIIRTKSG